MPNGVLYLAAVGLYYGKNTILKHEVQAIAIRIYIREEEYVLVQYTRSTTHLYTKTGFRQIFFTLRAAHFESWSTWAIESRTVVVDTVLRSS